MGEVKEIAVSEGVFGAYCAGHESGRGKAAVVVLQEAFGVTPWLRSVVDGYAARGYIALAPDLFWRFGSNILLDPADPAQLETALGYYAQFDLDRAVGDIAATIAYVRALPASNGRVGTVGYCLGGSLSFLAAIRTDADASACYYGPAITDAIDGIDELDKPTVIHLAALDGWMPPAAQDKISRRFAGNEEVSVHVYAGADHGFCRETDARHYHPEAAGLADKRTEALFTRVLVNG